MEKFVSLRVNHQHPLEMQKDPGFKSKKVVLLASPWVFQSEPEFQSQQLGLAYVGAYIEKAGHEIVAYIDPMLEDGYKIMEPHYTEYQKIFRVGHSDDWIISKIPPDTEYVFVNAPFTDSRFVFYPLCHKIKEQRPDVTIVAGGVLATTLSYQVMEHTPTDILVKGEGEIASARILNGEPLDSIPGVIYRTDSGELKEHPSRAEQLHNIDDFPWITQHKFRPMEDYVSWSPRGNQVNRTFSYITSRGCPFTCEFCSIPEKGQRWRSFSPERVIQEIQHMIDNYGVTHIEIEDDNFTLKSKHSLPILKHLKELREKGYDITPSFPNGVMIDRLDREHVFALKEAGTDAIYLPVESGHLRNLIAMNKPLALKHLEQTLRVAEWCGEAGLQAGCFFIIGYPGGRVFTKALKDTIYKDYPNDIICEEDDVLYIKGEDDESFEETCNYAAKLLDAGAAYVTPLIATPYPGTSLYDLCEKFGWLRRPDHASMVTTISYQNPKVDFINIETPWTSAQQAFDRWKDMASRFSVRHNVIKKDENGLC